ncbi:MAG TPA: hypothetical protein EYG86_09835 [Crocinitomicaceae bacterium]|nr:hypothetical protein [Crocinitomicaceae bacterium]
MLKAFLNNRSLILVFIPVIIALFCLLNWWSPYHLPHKTVGFGLWGNIPNQENRWFSMLAVIIISSSAILVNVVFNRNQFIEKNNYLPALLFTVLMSFFHSFYFLDGLVISQLFILLSLIQLLKLNQKEDGRRAVFNAAFLFGVAFTFFPVLLLGIPFLFLMIWINRPFIFRESMLAVAGVIIPMIYAGVFNYAFEKKVSLSDLNSSSKEIFTIDMWLVLIAGILFVLIGSKRLFYKFNVGLIKLKKTFRVLFLLTIMLSILFLLDVLTYQKVQSLSLLITPLVLIIPYAFTEKRRTIIASVLFYVVFAFSVSKFFVPFNDLAF